MKVYAMQEAMDKAWWWTDMARGEFSCLGEVEVDKDGDIVLRDVHLFAQQSSATGTELDPRSIAEFLCKHPDPDSIRCWLHSHGSMGVFWSKTDEECISGLNNNSLLLSIVVNKKHETRTRLDLWKPARLTVDKLELQTLRCFDPAAKAAAQDQFKQLVSECTRVVLPQAVNTHFRVERVDDAPLRPPYGMTWEQWDEFDDDALYNGGHNGR